MYKFGYIGIVGKTNVGKSTLINTLVGQKVAIVSPKTQTTRDNILGILTQDNYQLVFVDTPGIHKTKNYLDKSMMKNVRSVVSSVDVLLYIIDATAKVFDEEIDYIKNITDIPVIVGLSKIDKVAKSAVLEKIGKLSSLTNVKAFIPFSSVKGINTETIMSEILTLLPESQEKNFEFEEDMYTDKSLRFLTAEIIREKTLYLLEQELPHGIAIEVTKFTEKDTIVLIDVDLICERQTHKKIIIGKNGTKLKEIGMRARADIEKLVEKKVMLKIWVKVVEDWRFNKRLLTS